MRDAAQITEMQDPHRHAGASIAFDLVARRAAPMDSTSPSSTVRCTSSSVSARRFPDRHPT
jgi:hypothetical protein